MLPWSANLCLLLGHSGPKIGVLTLDGPQIDPKLNKLLTLRLASATLLGPVCAEKLRFGNTDDEGHRELVVMLWRRGARSADGAGHPYSAIDGPARRQGSGADGPPRIRSCGQHIPVGSCRSVVPRIRSATVSLQRCACRGSPWLVTGVWRSHRKSSPGRGSDSAGPRSMERRQVICCAIHSAVGCGVTLIQTSSRRAGQSPKRGAG
jgi:hypothetical protein